MAASTPLERQKPRISNHAYHDARRHDSLLTLAASLSLVLFTISLLLLPVAGARSNRRAGVLVSAKD